MAHATLSTCAASTFASCDSVLVVGKRGTGKSTMLDYVVQCAAPSLDAIYAFGITLPPSIPELFGGTVKQWEWNRTLRPKELQAIVELQQKREHAGTDWDGKLPRIGVVFDDCDSGFRNLDTIRFLLQEGKHHNFFVAISAQVVDVVPRDARDCLQVVIAFPESSTLYRKSLRKILRVFNTDEALLRAFIEGGENEALVFDAKAYGNGDAHLFRCNAKKVAHADSDVSVPEPVASRVEFGIDTYWTDVSAKYATEKTIIIPRTDEARVVFFGIDPRPGVKKQVAVTDDFGNVVRIEAGQSLVVKKLLTGKFSVKSAFAVRPDEEIKMIRLRNDMTPPQAFLRYLYATLTLKHANFDDVHGAVYPEQEMVVRYISEDAHVLELGGGIGRNACIIASLLRTSTNLVVFESNELFSKELATNKARNGFDFAIEAKEFCSTGVSPERPISWLQLQEKYPWLSFDTLLAGALYHALQREPELLFGFKRVLLQNNYEDDAHKSFVAEKLMEAGMTRVYCKPLENSAAGHYLITPACILCFYEVWSK